MTGNRIKEIWDSLLPLKEIEDDSKKELLGEEGMVKKFNSLAERYPDCDVESIIMTKQIIKRFKELLEIQEKRHNLFYKKVSEIIK